MKLKVTLLLCITVATSPTCVNANGFGMSPIQIKDQTPSFVPRRCLLNPEPGRCRAWIPQYYFNTTSGICQDFIYGGCGGNGNRFKTFDGCQRECSCNTAPEKGPCRGHMRRWFYSPPEGVCRPFVFGGCGGNSNSYGSWKECSNACGYPDQNNGWWGWWDSKGHPNQGSGRAEGASPGYSRADFMKDYMMLGMVGEMELEGMGDIMNLYRQLQKMGGLSTMKSNRSGGGTGPRTFRNNGGQPGFGPDAAGFGKWGEGASNWVSSSSLGSQDAGVWSQGSASQDAGVWDQGSATQTGDFYNGQVGSANGFEFGRKAGSAYDSLTPLGYRGGGLGNTFTPLGHLGSLSNIIGTGPSNMAHELEVLKSILSTGAYGDVNFNTGSGGTNTVDVNNLTQTAGFNIVEFIKHLAAERLTPTTMMLLARTLGAVDRTGRIDINVMLSQLSQTMANLGLETNQQLKGVAHRYGALDAYGNIDMNQFLHGMAGSIGSLVAQMTRMMGPGASWSADTTLSGTQFVQFIRQLASGHLSPLDMSAMARSLGVLDGRGRINIAAMVEGLTNALSNPGIAADLQGTAKRVGAIDSSGNIDVHGFLSKIANSVGTHHGGFGTSGKEILQFISLLASGRATHHDMKTMANKVGAIDNYGNIDFNLLGRGIVEALRNPATTTDLRDIARHLGALDHTGNVDLSLLLRGVTGVLKGVIGGVGGEIGGYKESLGNPSETSAAHVVRAGRSAKRSKNQN